MHKGLLNLSLCLVWFIPIWLWWKQFFLFYNSPICS